MKAGEWTLRTEWALRGAGFPADFAEQLCTKGLADAALAANASDFQPLYAAAAEHVSAQIRAIAADGPFREAVAWQSRSVLRNCLDKLASGRTLQGKVRRQAELTVANYVQRYALKNDSIGFFGPVAWGRAVADGPALDSRPGTGLLARRKVFFEHWAIDKVARALSQDPDVIGHLRPRLSEDKAIVDARVRGVRGAEIALTPLELDLVRRCDGRATIGELTSDPELIADSITDSITGLIADLVERGVLIADLTGPLESDPEITLRAKLNTITDQAVRERLLAALDELIAARDEVASAAGDADRLAVGLAHADAVFEKLTGTAAARRGGEAYAGRCVLFEDTCRDVRVELGPQILEAVAEPLSAILDSARWLVAEAGRAYAARFGQIFDRLSARAEATAIPLAALVQAATPDLYFSFRELPAPVSEVVADFRRRWSELLQIPDGVSRHKVPLDGLAAAVREAFPASPGESAPWSSAVYQAPDLMIAARDAEAAQNGDFLCVLGELHMAMNTLDARPLAEFHEDLPALVAVDEAVLPDRVVAVPAKASRQVTSRTYPSALLSPAYRYWTMYADCTGAPGDVASAAELVVERDQTSPAARLTVRSLRTGECWPLMETLGEQLTAAVVNGFSPLTKTAHTPRVTIGRLVLARESWTFALEDLGWAKLKDEAERYRQACLWRAAQELPARMFYRVATEDKPTFVDFRSPAFVHLLARCVRTSAREEQEQQGTSAIAFSEMLPDTDHCWLRDRQGRRYTSELRMVFVDGRKD
ncbi:hypothetical protein ABH926_003508 [Catenulispora sp. GP43]|uniref:lantibiotic dehydratase n=1 Tax=Catenulispora sp. GP43 TaxID=3156263 RepID=UPI0035189BED